MSAHAAATSSLQSVPNANRLFLGSCLALISTSVCFAVVGDIMGALKTQFVLTNERVGLIGAAALWGFTAAMTLLGPFVDGIGMRRLLRGAFFCHAAGALLMIFATGYGMLFAGALVLAFGNGTVEAACNPLVATIYPDRKTAKLNQFHVWFPGGIVLGGLGCFALTQLGIGWQAKVGLILLPTILYGLTFFGQQLPVSERVHSGVSYGAMWKALVRPLFIILALCMAITASLELGPGRWIPAILQAGGMHGILVLCWINLIMAVLRFFAGPVVHRLSPTGILAIGSVLAGTGLYWLSFADSLALALAAATVFALGVCYFWPTMLGVVAERVPRGGALALAVMGGIGMLASGEASQVLGRIADTRLPEKLDAAQTTLVLQQSVAELTALKATAPANVVADITPVIPQVEGVLAKIGAAGGQLPHPDSANALRAVIGSGADVPAVKAAGAVLNPADNYGGRMAFRRLAPLALVLFIVFGCIHLYDRARGGYKTEHIHG